MRFLVYVNKYIFIRIIRMSMIYGNLIKNLFVT